jgi:hypothetical protein
VSVQIETDWELEAEFFGVGNGWSQITRDVLLAAGVKVSSGMRGQWPTELTAAIGTLLASLNNSEANEAGILGLYTLGGAVCRTGFDYGIRLRFLLNGEVRWMGRLDSAPPSPGVYGDRDVRVRAVDYMDEIAKKKAKGLPTRTGIRGDEVLTAVIDSLDIQPEARAFAVGSDLFAFVFDQDQPQAKDVVQAATQCEMGRFYDLAGTLTFEGRGRRRNRQPEFVIDNSPYVDFDPGDSYQRGDVVTLVEVTGHPRTVDLAPVLLYSLQDKTFIGPGQTVHIEAKYVDPSQKAASVGGANMQDPPTDFAANTREDGAGVSMTAFLSGSYVFGGKSALLTITNSHPTQPLYITRLNLYGLGVYDQDQVTMSSTADAATLKKYGENPIRIDLQFHSSAAFCQAVADGVRAFMGTPRVWSGKFRFCANASEELYDRARRANISTCFEYREGITGTSSWFINAVDLEVDANNLLWVTWYCEPANLTHYLMLGQDVLGGPAVLAPF